MQVALAEGCAQPQLAVGVEVFGRDRDAARRLDHEQVGLAGRVELEPIGRASGDDDVIELAERQRAEHRVQTAAAGVDEDDLVGIGIAEQLLLRLLGPAASQAHVVVAEDDHPARDRVAGPRDRAGLDVMVPQHRFVAELDRDGPGRLEPRHAGRRPQVIDDAVAPRKAGRRDDLFVVDSFVLEAPFLRMSDVPLAGDRTESQIGRHVGCPLRVKRSRDGRRHGCARSPGARSTARRVARLEPAPRALSGVSSRMQPVPTVPEPMTSPGRSVASRLACASSCGQVQYIEPEFPRDSKRPLTAAVISRWKRPSR